MKCPKIPILMLFFVLPFLLVGQKVRLIISEEGALFIEGKDSILFYQAAPVKMHKTVRSNYIHPLYNVRGEVITENAPPDHVHQRGIYWAWHQLYIGDKRIGDGWDLKDIYWDVRSIKRLPQKKNEQSFTAEVLWKSPLWLDDNGDEKPFIKENTTITVYPTTSKFRQFDVEIRLLAMEEGMRLGGSENAKGYGGFSARVKLDSNVSFSGISGSITPENLPIKSDGWMNMLQKSDATNRVSGMCIMAHVNNTGYPNPWILREKNSMQNAVFPYPGAQLISLSTSKPTVLQYRIIVHQGDLSKKRISKIYDAFLTK